MTTAWRLEGSSALQWRPKERKRKAGSLQDDGCNEDGGLQEADIGHSWNPLNAREARISFSGNRGSSALL